MAITATTFLIVLLSVGFIILLGLTIALIVIMMGILRNIRRITERADKTTESFAAMATVVGKRLAPVAISAAIAAAMRRFKNKDKKE